MPKTKKDAPKTDSAGESASRLAKLVPWLRKKKPEDGADEKAQDKKRKGDGTRETMESIVVAFLAAFLFRTFEAEAFVIPTGSMAPTLFGRHKDVDCPECGTYFHVGASDEVRFDQPQRFTLGPGVNSGAYLNPRHRLKTAFCPNCRVEIDVEDLPVFTGDRILVNKWPYEIGNPQRWDVVVFKYPEEPKVNYIKRLVGLPGEKLVVRRGDVYAVDENGVEQILRKPPGKQKDLQIVVYDDTKPPRDLLADGWPERWQGVREDPADPTGWASAPDSWTLDADTRSYSVAAGDEPAWLRYRHYVPTPRDWEKLPNFDAPRARLVTDFLAYNTYTGGAHNGGFEGRDLVDDSSWSGYWVGDLTMEARVDVETTDGELVLELNEGFRHYRCTIDLTSGEAVLSHLEDGLDRDAPVETTLAKATTSLRSTGRYRVRFSNVDRRLDLWINGSHVPFDAETTFKPAQIPGPALPDLSPAGIAARGIAVKVDRLRILRDVYYRAEASGEFGVHPMPEASGDELERLARADDDPDLWAQIYNEPEYPRAVEFDRLADDEFFMLGDNSARSQDSRLWPNVMQRDRRHAVPRSALVGKAFFVYWPHGVPFLNGGKGYSAWAKFFPGVNRFFYHREITPDGKIQFSDYPLRGVPFYPQFGRMQRIR